MSAWNTRLNQISEMKTLPTMPSVSQCRTSSGAIQPNSDVNSTDDDADDHGRPEGLAEGRPVGGMAT